MLPGGTRGIVERPAGPGGAESELAGLLVAGEAIGLLVDAVFEAGADGSARPPIWSGWRPRPGYSVGRFSLVDPLLM